MLIVKKVGDKLVTEVPNAGDLNIVGIEVNGEAVTLNATFQGNPFPLPGKITGTQMGGNWEAGGFKDTLDGKEESELTVVGRRRRPVNSPWRRTGWGRDDHSTLKGSHLFRGD